MARFGRFTPVPTHGCLPGRGSTPTLSAERAESACRPGSERTGGRGAIEATSSSVCRGGFEVHADDAGLYARRVSELPHSAGDNVDLLGDNVEDLNGVVQPARKQRRPIPQKAQSAYLRKQEVVGSSPVRLRVCSRPWQFGGAR